MARVNQVEKARNDQGKCARCGVEGQRDRGSGDRGGGARTVRAAKLWNDVECSCYRYTAPIGYRFGRDLHEFVYVYDYRVWPRGSRALRAEAKADVEMRERAEPLTPCNDPECDWCYGTGGAT
jgi:hypothetical protein